MKKKIVMIFILLCIVSIACSCEKKCEHEYACEITIEPTCTQIGEKTYICKLCGNTYNEEIEKIDHQYDDGKVTKEPTCQEEGMEIFVCQKCGYQYSKSIDIVDHQYESVQVIKEATCGQSGSKILACKVCGKTKNETILATGKHTNKLLECVEATCDIDGQNSYECIICGKKTVEALKKLGHNYVEKEATATCESGGVVTSVCSRCGKSKTENVAALGHNMELKESYIYCDREGYDLYVCKRCGHEEKTIKVATGHSWKEATCTSPKSCTKCGATEGAALGHAFNGKLDKCSRCGINAINYIYSIPNTLSANRLTIKIDKCNISATRRDASFTSNPDDYLCNISVDVTYTIVENYKNYLPRIRIKMTNIDTGTLIFNEVILLSPGGDINETYVYSFCPYRPTLTESGTYLIEVLDYIP